MDEIKNLRQKIGQLQSQIDKYNGIRKKLENGKNLLRTAKNINVDVAKEITINYVSATAKKKVQEIEETSVVIEQVIVKIENIETRIENQISTNYTKLESAKSRLNYLENMEE